ncbi:MAG TPA: flippase [Syntrophales bacterium]|nr:flippase [Syntrophales bacterium]
MSQHLKVLAKNSLINSLGSLTVKVIGFITIPIFTRLLTTSEYGTWGLLQSIQFFAFTILSLGLTNALSRLYYDNCSEQDKLALTASVFWFIVLVGGLLGIFFCAIAGVLNDVLFHGRESNFLIIMLILSIVCMLIIQTSLAFLQIKIQPLAFSTSQVINVLFYYIGAVFLVKAGYSISGILIAAIVASGITMIIILYFIINDIKIIFYEFGKVKMLLKQGVPLMFIALVSWAMELSDRLFLNHYRPITELGLYSFVYQIVTAINFINIVFIQTVPIYLFKVREADKLHGEFLQTQSLRYYVLVSLYIALILSLFAREIVGILAPQAYHDAYKCIPILAFAYFFLGCFYILHVGIANAKKYHCLLYIFLIAGVSNVILNFLLIPPLGAIGAALATVASYFILMVIGNIVSQKIYYLNWNFREPAGFALLVIVLAALSNLYLGSRDFGVTTIKVALVAGCGMVFWRWGLLQPEKTFIREWLGGVKIAEN